MIRVEGNLARKLDWNYENENETKGNTLFDQEELPAKAKKRSSHYTFAIVYGVVLLGLCFFYVTALSKETENSMRLAELRRGEESLKSDISLLKSELDIEVDLARIETTSSRVLNMRVSEDIKYMTSN